MSPCVFLQRYPGQVILKSTRLRVSHTRRRDRGRSMDMSSVSEREERVDSFCVQTQSQPLCLSTSVQTDPSPSSTLTTQPVTALTASLPPLPVPSSADSSCSPCSLSSLLASPISPPPPPPPPPPLPTKEELSPSESPGRHGHKVEVKSATEELSLSPLGPFIPRFFDSSQLVSARKKLRKTPEFDSHSRRGTGTIWYHSRHYSNFLQLTLADFCLMCRILHFLFMSVQFCMTISQTIRI